MTNHTPKQIPKVEFQHGVSLYSKPKLYFISQLGLRILAKLCLQPFFSIPDHRGHAEFVGLCFLPSSAREKKKTTTATSTILTVDGVGLSISNALSGPASAAGPS